MLLDAMQQDGTVDKDTLAKSVKLEGDPINATSEQAAKITEWLQNNWDSTIGN